MSNSSGMPKPKDNSTSKFLQRIAGKKALAPPPTPRPVIGEHPVRILIRENSEEKELQKEERPRAESVLQNTKEIPLKPVGQGISKASGRTNLVAPPADVAAKIDQPKSGTDFVERGPAEEYQPTSLKQLDQKKTAPQGLRVEKSPGVVKEVAVARGKKSPPIAVAASLSSGVISGDKTDAHLLSIKQKYRLNGGEYALYKELYLRSHAVGKGECSFVVSEIMKATGMLERRIRNNIRRLKDIGWIVQMEGYNFENREKTRYRINIEPQE